MLWPERTVRALVFTKEHLPNNAISCHGLKPCAVVQVLLCTILGVRVAAVHQRVVSSLAGFAAAIKLSCLTAVGPARPIPVVGSDSGPMGKWKRSWI